MPLTVESGAALIPGAALSTKTRRVRVLRPFLVGGQVIDADTELDLPAMFAAEMVGAGKAQFIAAPAEAPAAPAEPPAAAPAPNNRKPAKPAKE